jgi:hypothetical protein
VFSLAAARAIAAAVGAFGKNFLPLLVNALQLYHDAHSADLPQAVPSMLALTRAIAAFARVSPPALVATFVDSVLARLEAGVPAVGALIAGKKGGRRAAGAKSDADDDAMTDTASTAGGGSEAIAQQCFLMGAAAALVPAMSVDATTRLLAVLVCCCAAPDRRLQKLSFVALEAMCRDADGAFLDASWCVLMCVL